MQIGSGLSLVDAKTQFSPRAVQLTDAEKKADFFERLMAGEVDIEEFPEIDMNFLRTTGVLGDILVPRFSIFNAGDSFRTEAPNSFLKCAAYASCQEYDIVSYMSCYGVVIDASGTRKIWLDVLWGEIIVQSLAFRALATRWWGGRPVTITISEEFSPAMIPQRIKGLASREMKLFDEMLLVKEANWHLEVENKPAPKPAPLTQDPLIIGRKAGRFFLLHSFDATKIEHYVSKEFTKSAKKGNK